MKQSVIWFIFISSPAKRSHCYLPYVKVLRLRYNNKIKKKSNHLFVESPPSFCPLTIIHHHPPQFLLLPPRFLPHFCSRSFEIIYHKKPNLCRTDRYNQYLQISHFEEEINTYSFLLLWNLHAQKLSLPVLRKLRPAWLHFCAYSLQNQKAGNFDDLTLMF